MNCAQFQNECSEVLEGAKTQAHEEHLALCAACRGLLEDMSEMVAQVRDLPLHEPGPQVWTRLRQSLAEEGLIREDLIREDLVREPAPAAKAGWAWPSFSWADALAYGSVAAILVVAFGLLTLQQAPAPSPGGGLAVTQTAASGPIDDDDLQLLKEVEARVPDARGAYETSLREINTQIEEARRAVAENPNDPQAVQGLMEAYQQKSMVYEMAMSRSVE